MKRIVLVLMLSVVLVSFKFNVYASNDVDFTKPLVLKLGSDYNEFIKVDGYTIITNTINVYQEGEYKIVYSNDQTLKEYNRVVYVTDDDSFYFDNSVGNYSTESYIYTLIDSVLVDNKHYTLMNLTGGRFKTNNYYLSCGISSTTIRQNTKLEAVDLEAFNDEAYIVGTGYNDTNGDPDIHYAVYHNDVSFHKIVSTDPEFASCIDGNDRYIFIGGYTHSSTDLFPEDRKGIDAFLLVVDRNTNEVVNKRLFSTNTNDYLVDIKANGNYLYAVLENETNDFKVIKLDIFGNVLKEKVYSFEYGYSCPEIKIIDGNFYLRYYYYDYNYLDDVECIDLVSEDLSVSNFYFNYGKNYILKDFDIINGKILNLLYGYKNGSGGYYFKMVEDENILLEKKVSTYLVPQRINGNYITFTYPNCINVKEFNTFVFKENIKDIVDPKNTNDSLNDYTLLINGKNTKHSSKSNINSEWELFGTYRLHYYFENNFDYLYTSKVEVLPFVGVDKDKIYDLGVVLEGNAILRVNGSKVEMPYTLDEEGIYKIELLGQNNASLEFNVEVKELTTTKKMQNAIINVELDNMNNDISDDSISYFVLNKNIELNKKSNFYFYFIPAITACVGILFLKKV